MDQRIIDDISDLLQGRDSEHREYPYGHPKYRPPADAVLPASKETFRVTIEFDTEREAEEFFHVFGELSRDAKERAIRHLAEIGKVEESK